MGTVQVEQLRQYREAEHLPFVIGWAIAHLLEPASATTAAAVVSALSTPHVGTPGAGTQGGNSTPARAPVAGVWKSPVFGPDSGE